MRIPLLKYRIMEPRMHQENLEPVEYSALNNVQAIQMLICAGYDFLKMYKGTDNRKSYELIGNDLYHCWSVWNGGEKVLDVKIWLFRLIKPQLFTPTLPGISSLGMKHRGWDLYLKSAARELDSRLAKYERGMPFDNDMVFGHRRTLGKSCYYVKTMAARLQDWLEYEGDSNWNSNWGNGKWSVKQ